MTYLISPGTLLFRGVDRQPDRITYPLAVNATERALWVVRDSLVAQTYIGTAADFAPGKLPEPHNPLCGSLVIFRIKAPLLGLDSTDEVDPTVSNESHAAHWVRTAESLSLDFVAVDEHCQTQNWGRVGHRSFGLTSAGVKKIELHALIPAAHREWPLNDPCLTTVPSLEEESWRQGSIQSSHRRFANLRAA